MNTAEINTTSNSYQVNLEVFNGPMDLLLYLIRKEEVDINDIPLAKITKQYLLYLEMMKNLNLEVAGEFILMAATLIRIKTKLLLPRDPEEFEDNDPREELIMALVEYRKYKEAGDILKDRALLEEQVYVPPSPIKEIEGRVDLLPSTSLYDLVVAFQNVLSTRKEELLHEVTPEEISIEERIEIILRMVSEHDGTTFIELFSDMPRKIIAVVTFIALLELVRTRRIKIRQALPFAEMRVYQGQFFNPSETSIINDDAIVIKEQVI